MSATRKMLASSAGLGAMVLLSLTVGAGAAAASGLALGACAPAAANLQCGRLSVPLDHSQPTRGSLSLLVARRPASPGPSRGVLLALTGGPGQSGVPFASTFAAALAPALQSRDLVVLDQRGTGGSGYLRCPGVRSAATPRQVASTTRRCAASIGPRRRFYNTLQTVQDIEALRQALGVERIALYGVSYGTHVALAYAYRYPQHVDMMVLDSVVPLFDSDPLGISGFPALRRVLRDICLVGCGSTTRSPVKDMAALVRRWERQPIHVRAGRRHRRRLTLDPQAIARLVSATSDDPILRADLPAAIRSALGGDTQPVVRALLAASRPQPLGPGFSDGLFLSTTCEEENWPWPRGAPTAARLADTRRLLSRMGAGYLVPFDLPSAMAQARTEPCMYWPQAPQAPSITGGPFPHVPTLFVAGVDDLTTPMELAQRMLRQLPGATLLQVPDTGHSVLGTDLSGCAVAQVGRFFSGLSVTQCPFGRAFLPARLAPRALRQVPAVPGVPGRRGRTMRAVVLTLEDTARWAVEAELATDRIAVRGAGLRGGSFQVNRADVLTLSGLVYVPGVVVSGRAAGSTITIHVRGRAAAHGSLRISGGLISGRLGGRRVEAALAGAAGVWSTRRLPTWPPPAGPRPLPSPRAGASVLWR